MGKIIETTYHDTVSKITEFNSSLINNSFYTLNDKKPSIVTYYNINTEKMNFAFSFVEGYLNYCIGYQKEIGGASQIRS